MVGLTNHKWFYVQILLNIEKSKEQDKERFKEWVMNRDKVSLSFTGTMHIDVDNDVSLRVYVKLVIFGHFFFFPLEGKTLNQVL